MNYVTRNTKPHGGNRGAGMERKGHPQYLDACRKLYGRGGASTRIPENWRDRLPDPASYYVAHVAKLTAPNGHGYAVGLCPFHDDHNPSFGVKLTSERGVWCCHAGCGKGDMVAFHQRLTGQDFKGAVRDLLGLGVHA